MGGKTRGEVAERIIDAAREAGVDIVQAPDLIEVLGRVPIREEIPPELFQAIEEILAFIYRINGRYASAHG
ncbi:EscU/YscU/HrcU family type III secretion system export apparatus switch protein [Malonomonas rubra]|uniref:EscU/YscU/HrcU family type III secretion system export apparatus switch protein n=1 Tax=Malonomonas rubra TaxID=57040 RepID=UPI0026EA5EA9|nr:EscU/YscU/HrcU family type III secretion system export apparatus switch protein [Malonomonas rubra]